MLQMLSSKKIHLYRDFAAVVYLSEAQNPTPPPPITHCIRVYCSLIYTAAKSLYRSNFLDDDILLWYLYC
jgi:hypothetical protein